MKLEAGFMGLALLFLFSRRFRGWLYLNEYRRLRHAIEDTP